MKRTIISLLLASAMLLSTFSATALTVEEKTAKTGGAIENNVQLSSDSALGNIISGAVSDADNSDGDGVTALDVKGKKAEVALSGENDGAVKVELSDEETGEVKASGVASVSAEDESVSVKLEGDIPENYVAKAVLLDESSKPLDEYVDESKTLWHEEFSESTVDDYAKSRVINMDDKDDTNFAVLNRDVAVIDSDNKLSGGSGKYVFTDADDEVKALSEGDVFCYNQDDPENLVIGKISDITRSGDRVTVCVTDPKVDEAFDIVKIDFSEKECMMQVPAEPSRDKKSVYSSGDDSEESSGSWLEKDFKKDFTKEFSKDFEWGPVKGNAKLTIDAEVTFEYSILKKYAKATAKAVPVGNIHAELGAEFSKKWDLATVKIPTNIAGLTIDVGLGLSMQANAAITADFNVTAEAGFEWSTENGFKNLSTKPVIKTEFKAEGKFYVGLHVTPAVDAFGIIKFGMGVEFGPRIEATDNHAFDSSVERDKKHECGPLCIAGTVYGKIAVFAKLDIEAAFFKKNYEKQLFDAEMKLFDFYFSALLGQFGFGQCPNISYKTTFKVVDADGNPVDGALIDNLVKTYCGKEHAGKLTAKSGGTAAKFLLSGPQTVTVSAEGYQTKEYSFGVINSAKTVTIALTKGVPSVVECETDSSFAAAKSYLESRGAGAGYDGIEGYVNEYDSDLEFTEPTINTHNDFILSTAFSRERRSDTAWVQKTLAEIGYDCPINGYYGKTTAAAVKEFQKDFSMPATGICTYLTIYRLKFPYLPVSAPTLSFACGNDVAVGSVATVNWNKVKAASRYNAYLYKNGELVNTVPDITGRSASFILGEAAEYEIKISARNNEYISEPASTGIITAHRPCEVVFEDKNGTVLSRQTVAYGEAAIAPVTPEITGYTFSKWDKSFSKITEEGLTVSAVYTKNIYDVTFVDVGGNVLASQKVAYGEAAEEPTDIEIPSGYTFVGWDRDFSNITGDTKVWAVLSWDNEDLPVVIDALQAVREDEGTGYTVTTTIRNYDKARTNGRLVVALKTDDGKFLTMTESAAFTLDKAETKTLDVYVPYETVAKNAEVYVVETYGDLIPMSESMSVVTDNSNTWTGWITEANAPKSYLEQSEERTEYRYKERIDTTSYATSLAGYTRNGYSLEEKGWGSRYYVEKWPEGFDKTHSIYGLYNRAPVRASEDATSKVVVTNKVYEYIYWHWCRGEYKDGPTNRSINGTKTSTFDTFHACTIPAEDDQPPYYSNATAYQNTYKAACDDSYWWYGNEADKAGLLPAYRQDYTIYKKLYNYYKWSDWSEWSTTPKTEGDGVIVETRQTRRYRTASIEEDDTGELRTVSGTLSPDLAGKQLSLFIYKIDDASDYTNEYIAQTVIDENGGYSFSFKLREEPTSKTGDYTVCVGVEGAKSLIYLDSIKAPKAEYTVNICDWDGTVFDTQTVLQGESASLPLEIPQREGYTFAGWDYSNRGIYEDLNITAMYVPKEYTVLYIDWENERYDLRTYSYGDTLEPPAFEEKEGLTSLGWDAVLDGNTTVTSNMVVTAKYGTKTCEVVFYDFDGNVLSEQTVSYGGAAELPELESDQKREFVGWRTTADLNNITENLEVYPDYNYLNDAQTPTASVHTGAFDSAQTVALTCGSENARIYYSVNGGEPQLYTEPLNISENTKLSFWAEADDAERSEIVSELYAINDGEEKKYPVTVYLDGKKYGDYLVSEGGSVENLVEISKPGRTFECFCLDSDLNERFDGEVNGALTLYAKLSTNKYTVKFTYPDGTLISEQEVEYLGSAIEPERIDAGEDYAFVGWNTDKYICVTENLTVTAVIKPADEAPKFSLNRSTYVMDEGYSYTLKAVARGLDTEDIVWQSGDENVITVDENGEITAVGEGQTFVTASVTGTPYYAQCFVTVNKESAIVISDESGLTISDGKLCGVKIGTTAAELLASFESAAVLTDKDGNTLSGGDKVGTSAILTADGETVEVVIYGDIDGDGVVNNKDAAIIARYISGKESLSGAFETAADVNGDGEVNNRDAAFAARFLVGKEIL